MAFRVAIQGFQGCFHEQAARLFYNRPLDIVECATFEDLYQSLDEGRADAAVMAIENTVSGGLLHNFELLRTRGRRVKGEVYIQIGQNLMTLPGQKLEDIKEVRTHYMAINQTRPWFKENAPWIRLIESEDTAKSARDIALSGEMGVGAVASELAAQLYGMDILAPHIETHKQNFTRFLVIDDNLTIPEDKIDKAVLCFTLPHKPGSLAQILTILSFYEMNLTRIQSLPIPGRQWQYFFYVDIKFSSLVRYRQALSAVRPLLEDIQILGEYTSSL
ncbi:MAG: prephenate dehydratase [Bacteroidales bacterium]|nr:prephenate dehydratase [Bacteroidales bacterium]